VNCPKNNFSSRKSNFFEISSTFILVNSKFHISKFIFEILCLDPAVLVKSHEKSPKSFFSIFFSTEYYFYVFFDQQFTVQSETSSQYHGNSSHMRAVQFKFSSVQFGYAFNDIRYLTGRSGLTF